MLQSQSNTTNTLCQFIYISTNLNRSPADSPSHPGLMMPPEAIKIEQQAHPPPLQILQDHPSQHHAPLPVTSMESGPPEYMRMPHNPASAFSLIPSTTVSVESTAQNGSAYNPLPICGLFLLQVFPRQYLTKPSIVSASDYRDHHNVSPASSSMYQPPPNIGAWPGPNWNHPDDEASVSPPHYRYVISNIGDSK